MWQRRWVIVSFNIGNWRYRARVSCSVNLNTDDEFIDPNYCEDMEDIEDVELVGPGTHAKIPDDDVPKPESQVTIEDILNCSYYELYL